MDDDRSLAEIREIVLSDIFLGKIDKQIFVFLMHSKSEPSIEFQTDGTMNSVANKLRLEQRLQGISR